MKRQSHRSTLTTARNRVNTMENRDMEDGKDKEGICGCEGQNEQKGWVQFKQGTVLITKRSWNN